MEVKKGVSLVVLVITIVIMGILTGITIIGIENIIEEAQKDDFITEIAVLRDKVKEYYILMGKLPVKIGNEYTASELSELLTEQSYKTALLQEIAKNKDDNNKFLVIDLSLMDIKTSKRGITEKVTDVFCVATNTLNVYYVAGVIIEDSVRFSLSNLVETNDVENTPQGLVPEVELDNSLKLIKNTEIWTNEIQIQVKCDVETNQSLQYSIGGQAPKVVPNNNVIVINSNNMTPEEQGALAESKQINVSKLENEDIIESKIIDLVDLDISAPQAPTIEILDTDNTENISLKISSTDIGGSGIKAIYYDYVDKIVDGVVQSYYYDRSQVTAQDLLEFGKKTTNGIVNIPKEISKIVCMSVDNAGNISEIIYHSITVD